MKNILFTLVISFPFLSFAQNARLKEANKLYNNQSFYFAAEAYEDVLERTQDSSIVSIRIAECYDKIENNKKAVEWYDYINRNAQLSQKQLMRSAIVRRQIGDYKGSLAELKRYERLYGANDVSQMLIQEHYLVEKLRVSNGTFELIQQNKANTDASEMGVSFYKENTLFMSSARRSKFSTEQTYMRSGAKFYNLYLTDSDKDGILSEPKELKSSKYHDGPIVFDSINDLVYFTRNNYINGKSGKDNNEIMRLKIYRGKLKDNKIVDEVELAFNSDAFSSGHPTISEDGKTLFFASDRPGGLGGSDIYKVNIDPNGNTSEPINMGKEINSSLNEFFPFFHSQSNQLFYSSEGFIGIGGLDVFAAQLNEGLNTSISKQNLGAPINSEYDDFAFILDKNSKYGYFSSNRTTGKGDDDVYGYKALKPLSKNTTLEGLITDVSSSKTIPYAEISLLDDKDSILAVTQADSLGNYYFLLDPTVKTTYKLVAKSPDYSNKEDLVNTVLIDNKTGRIKKDVSLTPSPNKSSLAESNNKLALYIIGKDKQTNKPLPQVNIRVYDNKARKEIKNYTTNDNGDIHIPLNGKEMYDELSYQILLDKPGYAPIRKQYRGIYEKNVKISFEEFLSKEEASVGKDIAKDLNINPIYFDVNKFNIRKDAKNELDKIVRIMNEYPEMEIELGSHTDCRQSAANNQILSSNRALASAEYIKKRISNPERISGKGYGETRLVNNCGCEGNVQIYCSEEDHQLNRRTEFIIKNIGSQKVTLAENNSTVNNKELNLGTKNVKEYKESNDSSNKIETPLHVTEQSADNSIKQSNENVSDYYIVKKGETLYRVFVNTGVSVERLKKLNNLKNNNVQTNQKLKLK